MTQGPEIAGLAAWIALTLPFAALATAIAVALKKRPRHPARSDTLPAARGRYGDPLDIASPAPEGPQPRGTRSDPSPAHALESSGGVVDERALADLHFASARQALDKGEAAAAADHLRKSIRIASRLGMRKLHAEARLELAELARAAGDLTTACEHWQIARGLFSELRQTSGLAKAEGLMRQHGCPTDWVLNDF